MIKMLRLGKQGKSALKLVVYSNFPIWLNFFILLGMISSIGK